MESAVDPLDSEISIDGGPSLVSDGSWIWRLDLVYFVEKYGVELPSEFLEQIASTEHTKDDGMAGIDPVTIVQRWKEILAAYETAEKGSK